MTIAEWVVRHLHVTLSPWQRRLLDEMEQDMDDPCCDYRDHSGDLAICACPEHPNSYLHPLGARE